MVSRCTRWGIRVRCQPLSDQEEHLITYSPLVFRLMFPVALALSLVVFNRADAQQRTRPDSLAALLRSAAGEGSLVRVGTLGQSSQEGRVASVTDSSLVLSSDVQIRFTDIESIDRAKRSHKGAAIGAIAGGFAGALLANSFDRPCDDVRGCVRTRDYLMAGALGASIGLLIGELTANTTWQRIWP